MFPGRSPASLHLEATALVLPLALAGSRPARIPPRFAVPPFAPRVCRSAPSRRRLPTCPYDASRVGHRSDVLLSASLLSSRANTTCANSFTLANESINELITETELLKLKRKQTCRL